MEILNVKKREKEEKLNNCTRTEARVKQRLFPANVGDESRRKVQLFHLESNTPALQTASLISTCAGESATTPGNMDKKPTSHTCKHNSYVLAKVAHTAGQSAEKIRGGNWNPFPQHLATRDTK